MGGVVISIRKGKVELQIHPLSFHANTPQHTYTHTRTRAHAHTHPTHICVCLCHLFPKNVLRTRSDALTTITIQSLIPQNTTDHDSCVNIVAVFLGMCGKTDPSSWHLAFSCLCLRQNVEQTPEATQRDRQHHTCPSFPPSTKVMTATQPSGSSETY